MNRLTIWLCAAATLGLVMFLVVIQPWRSTSDLARSIAVSLRESPVYVAEDAPGLVDPERARTVIGDRAIVAAILDDGPLPEYANSDEPHRALCKDIAELVPTNFVVVFAANEEGEYDSAYCTGPDFPDPTLSDADAEVFAVHVIAAAEAAWRYRVTETNYTPELEEYVLAFDQKTVEHYDLMPRRGPVFDIPTAGRYAVTGMAMVAATVGVFLVLRLGALAMRNSAKDGREHARARASIDARLNRLADIVLHEPGATNADSARRYVDTLHRFRDATSEGELNEIRAEADELEKELRR